MIRSLIQSVWPVNGFVENGGRGPDIKDSQKSTTWTSGAVLEGSNQNQYDVVVIGAGPAGLMLGACLSRWGHKIKVVDNRPHSSTAGRADGFQPLTLSLLERMGLLEKFWSHQPAKLDEVSFWNTDGGMKSHITKTGSTKTFPDDIGARYPFTAGLHQGYLENLLIEQIQESGGVVQRPWTITDFATEDKDSAYPVSVHLSHVDGRKDEFLTTKYLFSGEGARSSIRKKLGIPVQYNEPTQLFWGVVDGIVETDFPDIKTICAIQSHAGSILVIPREGGMVRLYMQLPESLHHVMENSSDQPTRGITLEQIQSQLKQAFQPYELRWATIDWWSVYPIRQGVTEKYTLDQRVFLGGDACHVHSPKAGQGMNMAIMDSLNLAWKIHFVESGLAHSDLLKTYQEERKTAAHRLIDFDSWYARLFSVEQASAVPKGDSDSDHSATQPMQGLQDAFAKSAEFVSGYGVQYESNMINWSSKGNHTSSADLFKPQGIKVSHGRQFRSFDVIRVADSVKVKLEAAVPLDGSFHVLIVAGNPSYMATALRDYHNALLTGSSRGLVSHQSAFPTSVLFTAGSSSGETASDLLDVFRHVCCGRVYEEDRGDETVKASIRDDMGIDEQKGAVIVIRPDGFVGCTIGLEDGARTAQAVKQYFESLQLAHTEQGHEYYSPEARL